MIDDRDKQDDAIARKEFAQLCADLADVVERIETTTYTHCSLTDAGLVLSLTDTHTHAEHTVELDCVVDTPHTLY